MLRRIFFALLAITTIITSVCYIYIRQDNLMGGLPQEPRATIALFNVLDDCFFDYRKVRPIVDINTTIPTWQQLNSQFPMLSKGGHYKPTHCRPKHHLSIIIPYRDRETHLKLFLQHMHPFLQAQVHEYTIYVVELENNVMFKRGLLMNAGFIEVSKQTDNECFIFHDVDMLPMNAGIDYTCHNGTVIHPTFYVRQFNFNVRNFEWYVGGALSFHKVDFRRVNGFSNLYWGWGGEDDDMYRRLVELKIKIERPGEDRLRFESWAHKREEEFLNRGVNLCHAVPAGQAFTAKYYSKVIKRDLVREVKKGQDNGFLLHNDNAPPHSSVVTKATLRELGTETVKHPAYSSDLALCDYGLFPTLKSELRVRRFDTVDDLPTVVRETIRKLPQKHFRSCFDKWMRRWEK